MKDREQVVNLDKYKSITARLIVLHGNRNSAKWFDSSNVEHILENIKKFVAKKRDHNKYLTHVFDLTMFE